MTDKKNASLKRVKTFFALNPVIFANSSREFECGECELFEKWVLLNYLFLRIRDGLTEMIIRAKVNFFYDNILLLIKAHIQNIASKPGLTNIFLAGFFSCTTWLFLNWRIRWIVIYPMDSVFQRLEQMGPGR